MPSAIDEHTRDRTRLANRNTPSSWLRRGIVSNVLYRDGRGWRLVNQAHAEAIITKTSHIPATSRSR
jgi:hypothetical protein